MEDNSNEDNSNLDELQQALSDALTKAEENLNGWKRAQADLENFRRRKEEETKEWVNFGKAAALTQLLPVLDSLEQAMTHAPDPNELNDEKYRNWKIGLDGIVRQLSDTFKQMGIEKIEALGKDFDPHLHEAVKEVPGETDGKVAEQYQTGYLINGKVIRPAQVGITKNINKE